LACQSYGVPDCGAPPRLTAAAERATDVLETQHCENVLTRFVCSLLAVKSVQCCAGDQKGSEWLRNSISQVHAPTGCASAAM
jgi:hypothetical protein